MSKEKKRKRAAWLFLLLFPVFYLSCNNEDDPGDGVDPITNVYQSEIVSPKNSTVYKLGDKVPITVKFKDGGKSLEEITISVNGKTLLSSKEQKAEFVLEIPADSIGLGQHSVNVDAKVKGNEYGEHPNINITILSDTKPEEYGYKVVTKYPHDVEAYTQGLYVDHGNMYEGTGREGHSQLRLWDFRQNKVLQSVDLDAKYFGEGIAQVGDKIYQLTYRHKTGFVYDKKTMKLIRTFSYNTEGWGLTYDGKYLVMTDGTNNLYYYEPENFTLVKKMQVADNEFLVDRLNELEYINGEIWANVYTTSWVIVIDPATGKIKRKIDFSGLLTPQEEMQGVDVLNGIACDPVSGKLYVTGKLWPWLFEVELVKKAV